MRIWRILRVRHGSAVTADLREISHAGTRAAALAAIETFKQKYGARYARSVTCLTKDTEALLACLTTSRPSTGTTCAPLPGLRPFRAETRHWRVSGTPFTPIESVFATVRHRTVRTRGALSQKTARLMVFTLVRAASRMWRKLNGTNQLPNVIEGGKFTDGVAIRDVTESRAA